MNKYNTNWFWDGTFIATCMKAPASLATLWGIPPSHDTQDPTVSGMLQCHSKPADFCAGRYHAARIRLPAITA
eukprot:2130394-Amphidinium_carterae.1